MWGSGARRMRSSFVVLFILLGFSLLARGVDKTSRVRTDDSISLDVLASSLFSIVLRSKFLLPSLQVIPEYGAALLILGDAHRVLYGP